MEREYFKRFLRQIHCISVGNGCHVSVEKLVSDVVGKLKLYRGSPEHVFVVVDREGRLETSAEIHALIESGIRSLGYFPSQISILISDRMIENAILADEQFIRDEFGIETYCYSGDGIGGKHKLKQLYLDHADVFYKPTVQGVADLKKISLQRSASLSASVAQFLNSLPPGCFLLQS